MKLILINGKAEHGKDTLAEYLGAVFTLVYDQKVRIVRFADFVKLSALKRGWNGKKDKEGRTFLQVHGEEMRQEDKYCWVRQAEEFILLHPTTDIVIIPDFRFPEEVEYFEDKPEYEVITVRIIRYKGKEVYKNKLTPQQRKHRSETALDDYKFDFVYGCECGLVYVKEAAIHLARTLMGDIEKK